jgi:alginate O-acetyltransferase complex protein AlgF
MVRNYLFLVGLLFSCLVSAGDGALYGKPPPPDAVFFRVINISNQSLEVRLLDKTLTKLEKNQVSPYGFASAGNVSLVLNDKPQNINGAANSQYTLVWRGAAIETVMIEETPFDNKRQAQLAFYNLTNMPSLTLKTEDGKHNIVEGISSYSYGFRNVRAIKIATSVMSDNNVVASSEPLMLARDAVTSVFVIQTSNDVALVIEQAKQ